MQSSDTVTAIFLIVTCMVYVTLAVVTRFAPKRIPSASEYSWVPFIFVAIYIVMVKIKTEALRADILRIGEGEDYSLDLPSPLHAGWVIAGFVAVLVPLVHALVALIEGHRTSALGWSSLTILTLAIPAEAAFYAAYQSDWAMTWAWVAFISHFLCFPLILWWGILLMRQKPDHFN